MERSLKVVTGWNSSVDLIMKSTVNDAMEVKRSVMADICEPT